MIMWKKCKQFKSEDKTIVMQGLKTKDKAFNKDRWLESIDNTMEAGRNR
jgi:hypothetical protein